MERSEILEEDPVEIIEKEIIDKTYLKFLEA